MKKPRAFTKRISTLFRRDGGTDTLVCACFCFTSSDTSYNDGRIVISSAPTTHSVATLDHRFPEGLGRQFPDLIPPPTGSSVEASGIFAGRAN